MSEAELQSNPVKAERSRWDNFCRSLKLRCLKFDRFSRRYSASLNLTSAIFIGLMSVFVGIMTIVFAAQANRVADSSNKVAENQTTIMEQQLRLDSGNTMPNFVVRRYEDSPIGARHEAVLWIENIGGTARYAQVRVTTSMSFYRNDEVDRPARVARAQVLSYLDLQEVSRDESEVAYFWKFETRGLDAEMEAYWEELKTVLASDYGITDVDAAIDHTINISYMDYQGETHDALFYVSIDPQTTGIEEPRLSVLNESDQARYTTAEFEGIGAAAIWIQPRINQDHGARTQHVKWIARIVADNYDE